MLALGGPSAFRTTSGTGGGFSLEVSSGTYWVVARKGRPGGPGAGHPSWWDAGDTARDLTVQLGAAGYLRAR